MPCKRLQPSYRPSANSLTLVPTGTTEYIAAGDSQAAVPFPTEIGKGFRPSVKDSFRSFLFVVIACRNGREASLPEKGTTEAASCPKGGNMWRHWYGLAQAWGSTIYDWALGQILPRCREEVLPAEPDRELCQREDTGLPWGKSYRGRIHIWDYPEGNQAIRTPSPVQGLTGDPGDLTPVLGLASDCSRRGCLEDSTRVHRPGNWTGGEKKALVSPGEGEWHSKRDTGQFFPPITYPTHRKKLAQRGDCRILRRCSVSPNPQLCRCLPKRRRAPTHGIVHLHYPVGQPPFGDSLPFLLPSVADKELLRASDTPGAVHVYAQCSYGTQQR